MINNINDYYHIFYDCYFIALNDYKIISNQDPLIRPQKQNPTLTDFLVLLTSWKSTLIKIGEIAKQKKIKDLQYLESIQESISSILIISNSENPDEKGALSWFSSLQIPLFFYGKIIQQLSKPIVPKMMHIKRDGNSFFSAVAHQLSFKNISTTYDNISLRALAINTIQVNPNQYTLFLPARSNLKDYLINAQKDNAPITHLEIKAISRALNVNIIIVNLTNDHVTYVGKPGNGTIHLLYTPSSVPYYDSILDCNAIYDELSEKFTTSYNYSNNKLY